MKRGKSVMQTAKREAEKSRKGNNEPWRFWLPNDDKPDPTVEGQSKNERGIIILDASLDSAVGFHEHNLKINGKFGNHELCPGEWETCPLCAKGDKPYYIVMLTIYEIHPWTSKDGKKSGKGTRKLLAVKSTQMGDLENVLSVAEKNVGSLRGTFLWMRRDTSNAQSASIGSPITLDNGMAYDTYSEEELVAEFGHPAVKNREGKVVKNANEDLQPFNYEELFSKPSGADLAARYGGEHDGVTAGSSQQEQEAWGEAEEQAEQPAPQRTAPRRRGAAPAATIPEAEDDIPMEHEGDQPTGEASDPFQGEE